MVENGHAVSLGRRGDDQVGNRRPVPAENGKKPLVIDCATKDILITTQAKRNLSSRSGIGGVRSAT